MIRMASTNFVSSSFSHPPLVLALFPPTIPSPVEFNTRVMNDDPGVQIVASRRRKVGIALRILQLLLLPHLSIYALLTLAIATSP